MPGARRGFSLIELVVGLAIMALLLALGLPSLNEYLANSKIRAQASSFNSTLQLARAEAIRLNGGVELVLTDDAPTAANKDSSTLSATGRNWMVRSFDAKLAGTPATACDDNAGKVGTPVYTLVEVKAAAEGSQRSDGSS
ncbi:MAG: GspH/FimT family pseudopilin, partial [Betaproteobacteria bacterium]